MILSKNVDTAFADIPPHLVSIDSALKHIHNALNTMTPDAQFSYEYTKSGSSEANHQSTIQAIFTFAFTDDPDKGFQFGVTIDVVDSTIRATLTKDGTAWFVSTNQQIVAMVKNVHECIISPVNVYDRTISINGLTSFQKTMIVNYLTSYNLGNW